MKNKALFLDRDGTIMDFIYEQETGIIHTAFHPSQVKLIFGITDLLRSAKAKDYLTIIVSNQPGLAIGKQSKENFEAVRAEMKRQLENENAHIDAEYYCLHHPHATLPEYKQICDCRKPKTALFLQAAKEYGIDLNESWMIGDSPTDIIAGHDAGCRTIMLSNFKEGRYLEIVNKELGDNRPDYFVKKLPEAIDII